VTEKSFFSFFNHNIGSSKSKHSCVKFSG